MRFQRIVQGASLLLFLGLLLLAGTPSGPLRVDMFLAMDPLVFLGTVVSSREFVSLLLPALVVMVLTLVLGRFFCSMICPLGATIDLTDRAFRKIRKRLKVRLNPGRLTSAKFVMLTLILGAACMGVSFVYAASPLSLATRFYGLVLYPVLAGSLNAVIVFLRETGAFFGVPLLEYTALFVPEYGMPWATIVPVASILMTGVFITRLWCRFLCPAGAILALLSFAPFVRRRVGNACTSCNACRRACPMGAIGEDPHETRVHECIVCTECSHVCPADAVRFPFAPGRREERDASRPGHTKEPLSLHRRALLFSGLGGISGAILSLPLGAKTLRGNLVRPPGALPEGDFLARCIRCGECMKACPTNTLQPAGLADGLAGLLSPVITPREGPCEPSCTLCGGVCPTGALRNLSKDEKIWAKVGTASVAKDACIAWEEGKRCLVCDEVCPFGAVKLERVEESPVPVPFVDEKRCNGCGLCEYHCPVISKPAIAVSPRNSFRMEKGSYIKAGRDARYSFEVKQPENPENDVQATGDLPPGFEE